MYNSAYAYFMRYLHSTPGRKLRKYEVYSHQHATPSQNVYQLTVDVDNVV